jgi:hypothetical protein
MAHALETALHKALAVRLNLQISLSQLPMIEEWMDIHLDRWLEHNPTPPDMPNGEGVSYLAMLGTDLQRMWWGSWGDPRGFVPRMADYFKLCNIAKSDAHLLDQIGEQLEPALVGSWIGVWSGKVVTGWQFVDPQPWRKIEELFGTHEAKYALKKWVDTHHVERIERFSQSIGDSPFSEVEFAIPGATVSDQVEVLSAAFGQFAGAPLSAAIRDRLLGAPTAQFGLALRIRAGRVVRVGGLAPGTVIEDVSALCTDARLSVDAKFAKTAHAIGGGVSRFEYSRAGDRAGVNVYIEPGEPAAASGSGPTAEAAN